MNCIGCGRTLSTGDSGMMCWECRNSVDFRPPPPSPETVKADYEEQLRQLAELALHDPWARAIYTQRDSPGFPGILLRSCIVLRLEMRGMERHLFDQSLTAAPPAYFVSESGNAPPATADIFWKCARCGCVRPGHEDRYCRQCGWRLPVLVDGSLLANAPLAVATGDEFQIAPLPPAASRVPLHESRPARPEPRGEPHA